MYASSGLRRQEALHLDIEDLDFQNRMIKPKAHNGRTEHTWLTFFNSECSEALKQYLASKKDKNPKLFPMGKDRESCLWVSVRKEMWNRDNASSFA